MPIHDISLTLSETLPVWPSDPAVRLARPLSLDRGDIATVTHLALSAHTGTHVDAPCHFIPHGAGVDELDLRVLVGPALVVYAPEAEALSAQVLDRLSIPDGVERLIFRTCNSDLWARGETAFFKGFVAIAEDGARWLVERGVRLVGVDYLSVAPFDQPAPTHQVLLRADVIIIEGLNLSTIAPGVYQLICLPLKIAGSDGAPARAILID